MTTKILPEFQSAWAEWLALDASRDEDSFDRYSALEVQILDHRPKSLDEARRILDVIVAQSDMRCDGRDWAALKRVRAVIITAIDAAPPMEARRAAA